MIKSTRRKTFMSTEKELLVTEGESATSVTKLADVKVKTKDIFREKFETLNTANSVLLIGHVEDNPVYTHSKNAEKFYEITLKVKRNNQKKESFDLLDVVISDYIVEDVMGLEKKTIVVVGELRSRYNDDNRLCVQVFAENVEIVHDNTMHRNIVYVTTGLSKKPIQRLTPSRKMNIADLFLRKEMPHGINYYFPAIAWRRNAIFSGRLTENDTVTIFGRLQSRDYVKKTSEKENKPDIRTLHEISIIRIELTHVDKKDIEK